MALGVQVGQAQPPQLREGWVEQQHLVPGLKGSGFGAGNTNERMNAKAFTQRRSESPPELERS